MCEFMQGLAVGFLICLIHSIMWGIWTYRDRAEWENEQAKRDRLWQQKCADIVLMNYIRRYKMGE